MKTNTVLDYIGQQAAQIVQLEKTRVELTESSAALIDSVVELVTIVDGLKAKLSQAEAANKMLAEVNAGHLADIRRWESEAASGRMPS